MEVLLIPLLTLKSEAIFSVTSIQISIWTLGRIFFPPNIIRDGFNLGKKKLSLLTVL
jgi:hypothetical protein